MAQSEFAPGTYEKISYDDLITYVVFQLTSKKKGSHQTTFEKISYDDLITYVVFQLTSKKKGSHQTTFEGVAPTRS